ncbi:MAG: hypothetical protein M8353_12145, partial [ANME-2 cluster archaeon]|nr:hypothetical protein [ANME-2 cluster archaeon]
LDAQNKKCWACHTNNTAAYSDQVDESEIPDGAHPDSFNSPKNCTDCHGKTINKFGANLIVEHRSDNTAEDTLFTTYTCVQCHNNSIRQFTDSQTNLSTNDVTSDPDFDIGRVSHYANNTSLVRLDDYGTDHLGYCKGCHNSSAIAGDYGILVLREEHGTQGSCRGLTCHNGNAATNLHGSTLMKLTLNEIYVDDVSNLCNDNCHGSIATQLGSHGNTTNNENCTVCHMNRLTTNMVLKKSTPGYKIPNVEFHRSSSIRGLSPGNTSLTYGDIEYNRSRCYVCHDATNKTTHNPDKDCIVCHASLTANKQTFHSKDVSPGAGGPDCAADGCHNNSAQAIDVDTFIVSAHVGVNGGNDTNSKSCWLCHGDGSAQTVDDHIINMNLTLVKSCDDSTYCHGNTTLLINVTSHSPTATGNKIKTTNSTCEFCHNRTNINSYNETVQTGTDNMSNMPSGVTDVVAHYLKDITNGDTHLLVDTVGWGAVNGSKGCIYCHKTANGTDFNVTGTVDHGGNNCYGCHITGTETFHESSVVTATGGGP